MDRNHLFNRSTRPLIDSSPKSHYHVPAATIIQQTKKQKPPTIGSDCKLHGFNDFNFVANQYKNLSHTHTGYPYGSPPSSPNASLRHQLNAYDDNGNGYSPYYDDDSGFHTNNSSENFSCRSNHSHSQSMNYHEDPNDNQYHNFNSNQYQSHKEIQSSQNVAHKKGGFFKEWPRFGGNAHHKMTNSTNDQAFQQSNDSMPKHQHQHQHQHQHHHQQQYNCNKINSITPRPVNRLLDNGPFIFGVHSQAYSLPAKVKNDSVIKHSTATSVLTTKYTPIDPDANDDDANDLYRRCDAAVIDDNAQGNNKRVLDTAAVANAPVKEHDRRLKKNAEKCRTKTETPKQTKKSHNKSANAIKCVVVGDEKVGKTNLIFSYLQHRFTTEHIPTASDIYNFEVKVDDSPVKVELADTAGQDFLDPLRRLCYPDSDVFLLCFSVIKPDTFVAAREKWEPIFRKTHKPIVLIGTQSDLRSDSAVISQLLAKNEKPVSKADAWDYATSIGAKYIETSSRVNTNVKEAFDTAIWHALVSVNASKKPSLWKRLLCLT